MAELFADFQWWEGGVFAALLLAAFAGSWAMRRLLLHQLRAARATGKSLLRIEVLKSLVPLVRWGLIIAAVAVSLHFLRLTEALVLWLNVGLQAAFILLMAFVASSAVRVALRHWVTLAVDPAEARSRDTLAPFVAKACGVLFFILAFLFILENADYNVAGLLAGLGIGGLAVALAGKETLANLFGSIAVLVDRPFQVGDFIRIGETEGTVERIGLRSTRIRTPDGFLVSIPNQNVTTSEVANISARRTRRQVFTIGLVYDLSSEQMRQAVEIVRGIFAAHPQTDDSWIYWKDFGESSLDIQVVYWSKALAMKDFLAALEELNFEIKAKLDEAGFGFAFPTRTVVLEKADG